MTNPNRITGPLTLVPLIAEIARSTGRSRADVRGTVDAFIDVVGRATAAGHNVTITNFGTWIASHRTSYPVRNPRTGGPVTVPARWTVRFRPARRFSQVVQAHQPVPGALRKRPQGAFTGRQR